MTRKSWMTGPAARALSAVLLVATFTACHKKKTAAVVNTDIVAASTMRIHYHRADKAYAGWGAYVWAGQSGAAPAWPTPNYLFAGADSDGWGEYVDVPVTATATSLSFLVLTAAGGGTKDTPGDMTATIPNTTAAGANVWILSGNPQVYTAEPNANTLPLFQAQAVWLNPTTIVWPGATGSTYKLYLAAAGGMSSDATGVTGADSSVTLTAGTLSPALVTQFPQYSATTVALTVPGSVVTQTAIQGQLVVADFNSSGAVSTATSVQTAPLLDNLFATAAAATPLGLTFNSEIPTFALWAPTATAVTLNTYPDNVSTTATKHTMVYDPTTGIWSFTAPDASWTNTAYYDYNVTVFTRSAGSTVVTNEVQDPYSVSLNANSVHSMVLNLADAANKPNGWPGTLPVTAAAPTDSVIYELHMRDFSAYNSGAYAANAGKYLAFTEPSNPGMTHLAALQAAGLTHVHILPTFEFATVDEVLDTNIDASIPASTGDGTAAELYMTTPNANGATPQGTDLFNWGYDPWFYGAPEGSYSSDASNGATRVMEFRKMVQSLHTLGLRVIMDVVYNHTNSAGQDSHSVLDRIVPGYYNRLDSNGIGATYAGAGADVAVENAMMARLMTDTLVRWADQYKVDGFRFDEMGLLPVPAMVAAQTAVNAVANLDGRGHTYFYGEGWNSAQLPNFTQAIQQNVAGTGIGTFNDRMRDSIRGGGPFDSAAQTVTNQGFGSGLGYDPNTGTAAAQLTAALTAQNILEVSLAGNLALFPLNGSTVGSALNYGGQKAGYTTNPQENIAYAACHDNETLWDISQYKQPVATTAADRARAQVVDLSAVLLANGVAFVQAGEDLLRSKSDDGNSYNSGDYFNRIFWDGSANNWAVGLPIQNTGNNAANLAAEQIELVNANAVATATEINNASLAFQDFLKIRKSSNMFRLPDAASIISNVRFPDQGLGQLPGVVVMQVGDGTTQVGDHAYASALTIFNASNTAQTITYPWYAGRNVALHPALLASADATVRSATFTAATGAFTVPARTTAVFVESWTNSFTGSTPAMYVRGDMNSWGATPMTLVAPHTWQLSVPLTLTGGSASSNAYGFKFAPSPTDWSLTYGDDGLADNKVSAAGGNASITAVAGNYVITFNDVTMAYAVLPPVWFPGVPTGFTAASKSATAITLAWSATGGATNYTIYTSTDGVAAYTQLATTSSTTFQVNSLTAGTKYFYKVSANNALFASAQSAAASATPAAGGGPTSQYSAMYMNGNWNGWVTKTGAGAMTLSATNTWTATLTLPAGDFDFKFDTDDNWGTAPGIAWTSTTTGLTGTAIVSTNGAGNIVVPALAAGSYTITFNDTTLAYTVTKN